MNSTPKQELWPIKYNALAVTVEEAEGLAKALAQFKEQQLTEAIEAIQRSRVIEAGDGFRRKTDGEQVVVIDQNWMNHWHIRHNNKNGFTDEREVLDQSNCVWIYSVTENRLYSAQPNRLRDGATWERV